MYEHFGLSPSVMARLGGSVFVGSLSFMRYRKEARVRDKVGPL